MHWRAHLEHEHGEEDAAEDGAGGGGAEHARPRDQAGGGSVPSGRLLRLEARGLPCLSFLQLDWSLVYIGLPARRNLKESHRQS